MNPTELQTDGAKTDPLIHSLGVFFVLSLIGNEESLFLQFGQFSIAPFDIAFWVMVLLALPRLAVTGLRANSNAHLQLNLLLIVSLSWVVISLVTSPNPFPDRLRDFRLIIYFLLPPILCGPYFDLERDGKALLKYSIIGGLIVSLVVFYTAATQAGIGSLGRNIRVGVWIIPVSLIALAYFRRELGIGNPAMVGLTLLMFLALILSQNRSQYVQFIASYLLILAFSERRGGLLRYGAALAAGGVIVLLLLSRIEAGQIVIDRLMSFLYLETDDSLGSRTVEAEGQLEEFYLSPLFGNGIGYRFFAMGPNGFELSTFAHNSWLFYLAKFGLVGSILILASPLLAQMLLFSVRSYDSMIAKYKCFLLACFPVYFYVDAMSAGLAYAPKTPITGYFILFTCGVLSQRGTSSSGFARPLALRDTQ